MSRGVWTFTSFMFVVSPALADDTLFPPLTLMGKWSCHPPNVEYRYPPPPYDCQVPFPARFAAAPQLMVFEDQIQGESASSGIVFPGAPFQTLDQKTVDPTGFVITRPVNGKLFPNFTYTGRWIAAGNGVLNASVTPKYLILSVLYSPPGMHGPKGTGQISYQRSNTSGLLTSISKTFKQDNSTTVSQTGGFWGTGAGGDVSFDYSRSNTNKDTLDVTISKSSALTIKASDEDNGINHDNDLIYLLLNPAVDVTAGVSYVIWAPVAGERSRITHVSVAWLKDPARFQKEAPSVKKLLEDHGVTESDYTDILAHDPLALGSPPDPQRYDKGADFQYVPPTPCDNTPPTETITLSGTTTKIHEQTATDEYSVSMSFNVTSGADAGVAALKTKLSLGSKWTWTTQTSKSESNTDLSSVTMSVGGPTCGWTGSPTIATYYDKVYGTYAFEEEQGTVALKGVITGAAPSGTVDVSDAQGRQIKLYPNSRGEWTILGELKYPVHINIQGIDHLVTAMPDDRRIVFSSQLK